MPSRSLFAGLTLALLVLVATGCGSSAPAASRASFSVSVVSGTVTIHITGTPAVRQLAVLFPVEDWTADHALVSSTPACRPGSLPGELDCGALAAGSHDVVLVGKRSSGTGGTYHMSLADIGDGSTSTPLAKDANGLDLSVTFSD